MESSENHSTKLFISLFGSVIAHSLLLIFIFLNFPSFEKTNKTIPFKLIQHDRAGSLTNTNSLNITENTLAAQEFLRTLNESTFEQMILKNTQKNSQFNERKSALKPDHETETDIFKPRTPSFNQNRSSAIEGLHNIFTQQTKSESQSNEVQQISTQSLNTLTDYEILLLQKLAQKRLYDDFHKVMEKYKQDTINYTLVISLFANGAIKSAQIKTSSSIDEIDQLAIKAAYQASPYTKPPKEDIQRNFRYEIPIIYEKR